MDFDIHILNLGAEITIFEDFIYVYIYEEQKETKQIHVFDFFCTCYHLFCTGK